MESLKRNSLIIIALILSVGLVLATAIAGFSFIKAKSLKGGVITVTGSSKKTIKSDLGIWKGTFSVTSPTLSESYSKINDSKAKVEAYFKSKVSDNDTVSYSALQTNIVYQFNNYGNQTNIIDGYTLTQYIEITSPDVDKILSLSKESTVLIDQGVMFESSLPQFYYTKLADLKIEMLSLASADAKKRADVIASETNTNVTGVKSDRMGVFQITPQYSNDFSDYGINDTTSINKEIMSVVNCEFYCK